MENQPQKTENEEKSELIKAFAEILDKHTSDHHDVYYLVRALRDFCEFMANQRFIHGECLMRHSRYIENLVREKNSLYLDALVNMADAASEAMALAGQNAEGINIFNKMEKEISETILS
jgi:hypothetical protein